MKTEPNKLQDQTESSSTRRSSWSHLSHIKWYQILVMLIVAVYLCYTSYFIKSNHQLEIERNQTLLAKISPENIKSVTVRLWKGGENEKPVALIQEYYVELSKHISKMTPTEKIGAGNWQFYRAIEIDEGSVGQFRILLMAREYTDGRARADFQIIGGPQTTSTLYYDADELWNWLQKLPTIAQQEELAVNSIKPYTNNRLMAITGWELKKNIASDYLLLIVLIITLFISFYLFDRIVEIEFLEHNDQWVNDGYPIGMFWKPIGEYPFYGAFSVVFARDSLVLKYLVKTPEWAKRDRSAKRYLRYLRISCFIGLIDCLIGVQSMF